MTTNPDAQQKKPPLHPCFFWCKSCTFRDSCVVIGTVAIHAGLANLAGMYVRPGRQECYDFYYHQRFYEDWMQNVAQHEYPHLPGNKSVAVQTLLKEKCERIYYWYNFFNVLLALTSFFAGLTILVAVFNRVPVLSLISTALFAMCVPIVIGEAATVFLMSGARFIHDIRSTKSDAAVNNLDCPSRCNPKVSLVTQRALSILGGIVFSCLYAYLCVCTLFFSFHMNSGYDKCTKMSQMPQAAMKAPDVAEFHEEAGGQSETTTAAAGSAPDKSANTSRPAAAAERTQVEEVSEVTETTSVTSVRSTKSKGSKKKKKKGSKKKVKE